MRTRSEPLTRILALGLLFALSALGAHSQSVVQSLLPPGPQTEWGKKVALDGDLAAVQGGPTSQERTLHMFQRVGGSWVPDGVILDPAGPTGSYFSNAIDLRGTRLIASSRETPGRAYVYERGPSGWSPLGELRPTSPGSSMFGSGVSIAGDLAVVGEHMGAGAPGRAVVFRHIAGVWVQEQSLAPSDTKNGDYFGHRVACTSGAIAVSAQGAVYVFEQVAGYGRNPPSSSPALEPARTSERHSI